MLFHNASAAKSKKAKISQGPLEKALIEDKELCSHRGTVEPNQPMSAGWVDRFKSQAEGVL